MVEQTAIVHAAAQAAPMTRRAILSKELLREEAEQRALLGAYVKQEMKEGTDFGKIPGTEKPTLLKPGAEKLISLFHCSPEFTMVHEQCVSDFDRPFFKYTFRCVIRGPGGAVLAEGYGSANSREARYRWRTANRKCVTCGKDAIIQGKAEFGGGWVCFKKKNGCGQKYGIDDPAITTQPAGRVENEDIADLDNTILKMAKKRAQVDGAIALARCSDMFTQDVEDFAHHGAGPDVPEEGSRAAPSDKAELRAVEPSGSHPPPTLPDEEVHSAPVAFGPHKGKRMGDLSHDELSESIDIAHAKLAEEPRAKWARAMKANLGMLEAEAALRVKLPTAAGAVPAEASAP